MKKIVKTVAILFLCIRTFSQVYTPPSFADVDTNYRTYVNNIFGLLEANRISTGLLADYGFDFTDPKFYNGVIMADSTLMEQGIYSDLYKTLYTSRFNTNAGVMRHPNIQDSLCFIARQKEVITLSGLLYKYNAIDPAAQIEGTMQTFKGKLRDVYVNGVWQNPYQEFTTVAISPSVITYNLTYCNVILPSSLFMSNMSSQISSIQFNADDGQGYRNIQFDVPVNLNYADTGWKHWIFRINLSGGQQLYSHSKVHFSSISNMAGSGGTQTRGIIDRRRAIVATEQFNGAFGVADIMISFRDANDQVLRRPLIVAEGFDPGHITSPEEPEGESTFAGFIGGIRVNGSVALRNLISGNNVFDPNSPSEYDIVYVNWRNGTDWLQRNALVLEEVIRWVNANKQPDLVTGLINPNVVLGSSMGGVIARMALGRMDRTGGINAHQTSLYVSLDAPHQGANVPLGYQAAARHATRMYISTGGLAVAVEIIQFLRNRQSPLLSLLLADQPASRQLLTNRLDFSYNIANATNQQFLQELRTQWAYPVNIRNIAISNGSECAIDQEFAPGSALLYHYRSTKTRFLGDLIFMAAGIGLNALNVPPVLTLPLTIPGSSKFELTLDIKSLANNGGNQVYYGNIKLTKKVLWLVPVSITIANNLYTAPTGLLPFDTYPGGFYTVSLDNQPGAVSRDWMFSYNNSFFIQRRFSFIPTTSALDIGQGNTALVNNDYIRRYIGQNPPAVPLNTPFQNFATAFNAAPVVIRGFDNNGQIIWQFTSAGCEPHEGLYERSSDWLAAEMNNNINVRTNCEAFCGNGVITGNNTVCTSQTFTAPFGFGVTYNWTVSNPFLVTLTPAGNSVVVTRNGTSNGLITLSVTISGACGTTTLSTPVTVGNTINGYYTISSNYHQPFQRPLYENNSPIWLPANQSFSVSASVTNAGSGLPSWVRSASSYPFTWSSSGAQLYFSGTSGSAAYNQRNAVFNFTANTGCGVATTVFTWPVIVQGWGFRIAVTPNPATDNIAVSLTDEIENLKGTTKDEPVTITLYNINNTIVLKRWSFSKSQPFFNLRIPPMNKGYYIITVQKGQHQKSEQILIE